MKPETIDSLAMGLLVAAPAVGFLIAISASAMGADVQPAVWTALGAFSLGGGAAKGASGIASTVRKADGE